MKKSLMVWVVVFGLLLCAGLYAYVAFYVALGFEDKLSYPSLYRHWFFLMYCPGVYMIMRFGEWVVKGE